MATVYIATTGNDTTGTGTTLLPWLTLTKAFATISSGDTIICKDGTYTFNYSPAPSVSCTVQAENTGLAIFDGGGGARQIIWPAATITFIGLCFTNIVRTTGSIISPYNAGSAVLTNCKFYTITLSGTSGSAGIINAVAGTITMTSCAVYGITISPAGTASAVFQTTANINATILAYNCVFNHKNIINGTNNTETVTATWKNCAFYFPAGAGVFWQGLQSGAKYINTLFTNNCLYTFTTNVPTGTSTITTDPLFYDAAGGNFNLRPTSPAISTGTLV